VAERGNGTKDVLVLHRELGFGHCTLNVIVPETWEETRSVCDLAARREALERPLRVATKYPNLTETFLKSYGLQDSILIRAEGTLEVAPAIGYADLIVDLVSTGTTLRDNRLRTLEDGLILASQASLIANRKALKARPEVLTMARQLLEFIVAHLRAATHVSVFANIRGESRETIAQSMFKQSVIGGLQGPTISSVITKRDGEWYAVHIVVSRIQLAKAIEELRAIGGSGVVVTPVSYIFEEEPEECQALLEGLEV
jgi:ATP phosphoribosyltransferase